MGGLTANGQPGGWGDYRVPEDHRGGMVSELTGFVEVIVLFNLRCNGAHGFVAVDVYRSQSSAELTLTSTKLTSPSLRPGKIQSIRRNPHNIAILIVQLLGLQMPPQLQVA